VHDVIGSLSNCLLIGAGPDMVAPQATTIPEPVVVLFQMTVTLNLPAQENRLPQFIDPLMRRLPGLQPQFLRPEC
jgi:hypothetical protein